MDFEASTQQLLKVIEIGRSLSAIPDAEIVRRKILEESVAMLGGGTGSLFVVEEATGDLLFDIALGPAGAILKHAIRLKSGEGLAGSVAKSGVTEVVNDVASDPRHAQRVNTMTGFSVQNALTVPLKYGERVIGVLQILNKQATDVSSAKFSKSDIWIAETLGIFAAIALENSQLRAAHDAEIKSVLELMGSMVALGDPSTSNQHGERVSGIVRGVGARMGMGGAALADLRTAGLLHDIGKLLLPIKVPAFDLSLDEHQVVAIREHARLGADLVARLPRFREQVAPAILHHHERFDGKGYPDGLAGAAIPLAARIIAVADAFEVLTSDEAYGPTLPPKEALQRLAQDAEKAFDPKVLEALSAAYRGGDLRHLPGLMPR